MGKEYVDRIKEAFEQKGFKGNSQINKTKFNEVLSSLTVQLNTFRADRLMIEMSLINFGSKPLEATFSLK